MRYSPLLLLSVLACGLEPNHEGVPLAPPAEYRTWFRALESCTGRSSDFDRIQWYVVEGLAEAGHYGWTKGWAIYLDAGQVHRREVVAHEELHILLNGDSEHKSIYWKGCL